MAAPNDPTNNHLVPLCYERPTDNSPQSLVLKDSDDADETVPVIGPLKLREYLVPQNAVLPPPALSTPPAQRGEV